MSSDTRALERSKALELSREYEKQGYRVTLGPSKEDLPAFLRNLGHEPDLIAKSPGGNLIIEVRSRESMRGDTKLARVAESISAHKNWELVLVYTNPRKSRAIDVDRTSSSVESIERALAAALIQIARKEGNEARIAALLLLWSTLEAAIARRLLSVTSGSHARTPRGLIRDAAMSGLVSRASHEFLEQMITKRNEVAHGNLSLRITAGDLKRLGELCKEILGSDDE